MPYNPSQRYYGGELLAQAGQNVGADIMQSALDERKRKEEQDKELFMLNNAVESARQRGSISAEDINNFHAGNLNKKREIASKAVAAYTWADETFKRKQAEEASAQQSVNDYWTNLYHQAEAYKAGGMDVWGRPLPPNAKDAPFTPKADYVELKPPPGSPPGTPSTFIPYGMRGPHEATLMPELNPALATTGVKPLDAAKIAAENARVAKMKSDQLALDLNAAGVKSADLTNPDAQHGLYVDPKTHKYVDTSDPSQITHIGYGTPSQGAYNFNTNSKLKVLPIALHNSLVNRIGVINPPAGAGVVAAPTATPTPAPDFTPVPRQLGTDLPPTSTPTPTPDANNLSPGQEVKTFNGHRYIVDHASQAVIGQID